MLLDVAFRRTLLLFLLPLTLFAARDPVGWSLSPATGFPPTTVGGISQVNYTLTNHLPFNAVIVTEAITTGGTFTVADFCHNISLAPNASCIVHVAFHAGHAGASTFQLVYGYHNNRIPLPRLSISGTAAPTNSVVGYFSNFPTLISITPAQSPEFTVTYVNESNAAVTGFAGNASDTNVLTMSPTLGATISYDPASNTCGLGSSPTALSSPGSCQLTGTISGATIVGTATVTGLYTYNTTRTATPTGYVSVIQSTNDCVLGRSVDIPFPTIVYPYSDNVLKFTFTNQCTSQAVSLGPVSVTPVTGSVPMNITTNPASTLFDTCSSKTLAGGESCFVLASVVPNTLTSGTIGVTASVSNGTNTYRANTNSHVDVFSANTHNIVFQNECNFDIWYGIENGSGTTISPDPTPSAQTANNEINYFLARAVTGQPQSFSQHGGMRDFPVSSYVNGAIWARTGCAYSGNQFVCQTGMCSTYTSATVTQSATCITSNTTPGAVTPPNPWTKAEFTINSTAGTDGVYDVSLINGFNVPIEIKALAPQVSGAPLTCTGAGAPLPDNTLFPGVLALGDASWNLDPTVAPSSLSRPDFILVYPGVDSGCPNDSACAATTACGMAFGQQNTASFNNGTPIYRRCGNFMGYSDLQNYAAFSSGSDWGNASYNLYNNYDLGDTMTSLGYSGYGSFCTNAGVCTAATFGNMVACQTTNTNALNSCYNSNQQPFTNCCGCVDWAQVGVSYNGGNTCPITVSGVVAPQNTAWTQTSTVPVTARNAIYWLKLACPTCYSFPFDDPSSSFGCTHNGSTAIYTSYQVTFCPGGLSGKPTGIAEGRCGQTTCPTT